MINNEAEEENKDLDTTCKSMKKDQIKLISDLKKKNNNCNLKENSLVNGIEENEYDGKTLIAKKKISSDSNIVNTKNNAIAPKDDKEDRTFVSETKKTISESNQNNNEKHKPERTKKDEQISTIKNEDENNEPEKIIRDKEHEQKEVNTHFNDDVEMMTLSSDNICYMASNNLHGQAIYSNPTLPPFLQNSLEEALSKIVIEDGEGEKCIEFIDYKDERHLPDLTALITKDLSEPYSIYTYRYFLHNWPHLSFLAYCGETCVGAIVCKLDQHHKDVWRGYIAMLVVHKDYRRYKIGSKLVQKALRRMIENRCDEIVLETEVTNRAALNLYENLGFVRDKRLLRYYLNGVDAWRLKLWLR